MMDWGTLLNPKRLRREKLELEDGRSPFQKDIDRVVYSAAFRRLANKTQVHPLPTNDHIHNRLTHSVETASVGRSLGTIVGAQLESEISPFGLKRDDFGYVVQAACLAHDIGNPPFGHAGEQAIGSWFENQIQLGNPLFEDLTESQKADFVKFEGNAQGFRILTQHENHKLNGGLQLTFATLATFTKYPRSSAAQGAKDDEYIGAKKFGFFDSEKTYFQEVADNVGLSTRGPKNNYWSRHPLAFLVEAADDTCYNIVDIEDAYTLGDLNFDTAERLLSSLAGDFKYQGDMADHEKVAYLRALAIGETVRELASVFVANQADLLGGTFSTSLVDASKIKDEFEAIEKIAKGKMYTTPSKTKLELVGHRVIHGLLNDFIEIPKELKENKWNVRKIPSHTKMLIRYMGKEFSEINNTYDTLLSLTDYISGMTDRFAVETYRELNGITL